MRDRHVPIADADSLKASAADEVPRADADTQRLVAKAITQLHPQVVEVLVLRYEHDYSDAEIARLLGKSRGAVALTLFRARARLKKLLRHAYAGRTL